MPVSSENLSERSYQYISKQMRNGSLKPGSRLVNRKLADEIGVSIIPVREAIRQLSSEGLVEHIPGSGSFVRQANRADLDELYVLRDALESCAAAEAAQLITAQQLEDLETVVKEFFTIASAIAQNSDGCATPAQHEGWLNCEKEFHQILIDASRNRLLAKIIQEHRIISAVFSSQGVSANSLTPDSIALTCKNKTELLEAFQNRDSDLARQLMSKQIQVARKKLHASLRKQERDFFA